MGQIFELISQGAETLDDCLSKTTLTRKQVLAALRNLVGTKKIIKNVSNDTKKTKYRVNTNRNKKPEVENTTTRINSVFALGGHQNET